MDNVRILSVVATLSVLTWLGEQIYRAQRIRQRIGRSGHHRGLGARRSSSVRLDEATLALLCVEVAARIRAGNSTVQAWQRSWARLNMGQDATLLEADGTGIPEVLHALAERRWGDLGMVHVVRRRRAAVARTARALLIACRYTAHAGAPLADILESTAAGIDEAEAAHDARAVAAAGALTSARILVAMPLVGVALAQVIGANPIARFGDGASGSISLAVGVAFFVSGLGITTTLLRRARHSVRYGLDGPMICDLATAGLEAGAAIPTVIEALGNACEDTAVAAIGRRLRVGMSWRGAWRGVDEPWNILAQSLEPAWCDGASPTVLLARTAAQIRARRLVEARIDAEKLGVRLVLPLGACLLPAFIALGVVPIVLFLVESGIFAQ
ncbi:hypothetical protein [Schaalia suimastitidis]|uniref:hypothetical protein n=1 Tax=Schaalia suimastitidis TaxID=121163 RepID=UPI00040855A4|nr:hypothetical protein [Schaalia suimastitidis]